MLERQPRVGVPLLQVRGAAHAAGRRDRQHQLRPRARDDQERRALRHVEGRRWRRSRAASARRSRRGRSASTASRRAPSTRRCSGTIRTSRAASEKVEGAIGKPEDIAAAVCFLAAPEARFITGTTLVVDGGRLDILRDGRPWPQFMFATGIENSYPTIEWQGKTVRAGRDGEDAGTTSAGGTISQLVQELGIEYLRYGPPYFSTHLGPGKYDWSFADETFGALHDSRASRRSPTCATSACPTGSATSRTPTGPRCSPSTRAAFAHALSLGPVLHAGQRDLHRRDVLGAVRLVERAADDATARSSPRSSTCARRTCWRCTRSSKSGPTPSSSRASRREYFHAGRARTARSTRACYNEKRFLSLDLTYGHHVDVDDVRVPARQRHDPRGVPLVPRPPREEPLRDGQRLLRDQRAPGARRRQRRRRRARSSATTRSRTSTSRATACR